MILAIDVGGTNTRLALLDTARGEPCLSAATTYRSRNHSSLEESVARLLSERPVSVTAAGVGVAGPVQEECAVATNLPWAIDARVLAGQLRLPRVGLFNDVQANAWGIPVLPESDFLQLN